MAFYKYLAAAAGQKSAEVEIEAESTAEAIRKLKSRKLTPVRYLGESDSNGAGNIFSASTTGIDVIYFTSELAPLLKANIPLERALAIMAEGCEKPEQKNFILSMRQGLHEGKKLSAMIRSYGKKFPGFYANLIESGEESGALAEVAGELERFLKETKSTRDFIISSSIYPAVVLAVSLAVSLLMFLVFIPRFAKLFTDMGREMPPSMDFLLTLSSVLSWTWWSVPLAVFLLWKSALLYFGRARVKEWKSNMILRLPVAGKLIIQMELSRFVRTLAVLLGNHVEIIHSVQIAVRVIQNQTLRSSFDKLESMLKGGKRLSGALYGNPFLPAGLISKIRVGEETGETGTMLGHIADQMEEDARKKIKRILNAFEPLVIVFLALIVAVVVLSIFMAIMDLNAA